MNEQRRRLLFAAAGCVGLSACGGSGGAADRPAQDVPTWNDPITPDNFIDSREALHTGGTRGWVCANRWVKTTVGPGVTNYEWNLVAILENHANAGENVAAYAQANAYGRGSTWGHCVEAADRSRGQNPTVVGQEVGCWFPGPGGRDTRIGQNIVVGMGDPKFHNGHATAQGDEALRINGNPDCTWRKGIRIEDVTEVALDLANARPAHLMSVNPALAAGQPASGAPVAFIPVRVGNVTRYIPLYA